MSAGMKLNYDADEQTLICWALNYRFSMTSIEMKIKGKRALLSNNIEFFLK